MTWEKYYKNGRLPGHTRKDSFWWRDNLKILYQFKEMALPELKNGGTILFWKDNWNGLELQLAMPELFSYAKNQLISAEKSTKHKKLYIAISAALVRTGIPTTASSIKHFTRQYAKPGH
jgi:hypothetical protein